jgi:hypothetical protein
MTDECTDVGFQVLTVAFMKSTIFWDVTPSSSLKVNRRFGGTYRLHLQGLRILLLPQRYSPGWALPSLTTPPPFFSTPLLLPPSSDPHDPQILLQALQPSLPWPSTSPSSLYSPMQQLPCLTHSLRVAWPCQSPEPHKSHDVFASEDLFQFSV